MLLERELETTPEVSTDQEALDELIESARESVRTNGQSEQTKQQRKKKAEIERLPANHSPEDKHAW